jgi:[protein-PII] uridylyltransferase
VEALPYCLSVTGEPSILLRRLAPDLDTTCGDYLQRYRQEYRDSVESGGGAVKAGQTFSRVLDGLLGALFCATDARARQLEASRSRLALVAVGGYGRGLLGLRSDIDILLLCDDPNSPYVQHVAEGLLYPLWDIGVEIGHAVRGIEETLALAAEDIRTTTTLIDLRMIAGDAALMSELASGARRHVFGPRLTPFLAALQSDTRARHKRFGDSLHLLEPDVKLGRGGLRDLDVAMWAANARWNARGLKDFVRLGVLPDHELKPLLSAHEFLWQVRLRLHARAGRQQDRLTFSDQEEIAYDMGFCDGITLAVEQFMQAYYRHAGIVAQTSERLAERAQTPRRRTRAALRTLGGGIAEFTGQITFEQTSALQDNPTLALRLYEQVLRTKMPPYGFSRDAIARAAADPEWSARLRRDPAAGPLFVRLLTATGRSGVQRTSLAAELHDVRLTTAMVPELEPLVGRVIHDVYHVYTFDVHAVRALDRLRGLARGKRFAHLGLASRAAAETSRKAPLFVAAFLHALGELQAHGPTDATAELSAPVVERLGFGSADAAHIHWLLNERDTLYRWATRRDTSDPEVLEELAQNVESVERLRDLYLLTVAILSTTNPAAMTSWKARLLDDLYFALALTLEGGSISERATSLRTDVEVGFVGDDGEAVLRAFVRRLPDRYVLANDADAIRRHARFVRDAGEFGLGLGPGPSDGVSELVLWADDRPGLLADVCAVLTAHHVGVVGAQVYTLDEKALDVLWVRRAREGRPVADGEGSRLNQQLRGKLETELLELMHGRKSSNELLQQIPKPPAWSLKHSPEIPTGVTIDNGVSPRHTVVEVFTRDRVGVLHTITRILAEAGLTIDLAKVNTEGQRVADVFYVLDHQGRKVVDVERLEHIEQELLRALGVLSDKRTPAPPH